MIHKQQKESFDNIFLTGYILLLTRSFIYTTTFDEVVPLKIAGIMRVIAYILLFSRFLILETTNKRFLLLAICTLVVSVIVAFYASYGYILDYAICIVFSIGINFNRIVKAYTITTFCLILLTVSAAYLHIIENYSYSRLGAQRLSMGFVYPTDFVAHVFFLACGICYLFWERIRLWHGIVFTGVAYILYKLTNSRGPSLMIVLLFLVCWWSKWRIKHNRYPFSSFLMQHSSVISAAITFIFIWLYSPSSSFWNIVDAFSSKRLSIGKRLLSEYGVTFLGKYIQQKGDGHGIIAKGAEYTYIDLSFMRLLVMYGIVFFVFMLVYSVLLNKKAILEGNFRIPVILLVISFYSIIAQHYFDFSYNFVLLAYFTNNTFNIVKDKVVVLCKMKS